MLQEEQKVIDVVTRFFDIGRTKDFAKLKDIQLDENGGFSSFSDVPPYELKDYANSIVLEELRFASISDYDYEVRNPKISMFGDTAVVAFELFQKGMLVDNKSFTGKHITMDNRATFVLINRGTWKIVHIHMSNKER